jgi:hypothetical protein
MRAGPDLADGHPSGTGARDSSCSRGALAGRRWVLHELRRSAAGGTGKLAAPVRGGHHKWLIVAFYPSGESTLALLRGPGGKSWCWVAPCHLPETQSEYRMRWLRQPMPLPIESTVSDENGSTAQFPILPLSLEVRQLKLYVVWMFIDSKDMSEIT